MTGNNNILENPKGSDFAIQRVQNLLFKQLPWDNVQMYGRAIKMPYPEEKTRFAPQVRKTNGDHADPLRDDQFNANIFFTVADKATTNEGVLYKIDCKVIFMLNLVKCYPEFIGLADEKAHEDVIKVLKSQRNFTPTSIGTGLKECLGEYDTENIKFTDVQPNHIFCVTGQLNYNISC